MEKKIEKLNREISAIDAERYAKKELLNEELKRMHLPAFKKKYEGKCFKYLNSYGGNKESWWMYIRFDEITEVYLPHDEILAIAKGIKIQIDCDGSLSHSIDDHMYVHSYSQHPISKKEFAAFIAKCKTILNNI